MEKKRIPSLDGVRGIGIFCVLIVHALFKLNAGGDQTGTLIVAALIGYPPMKFFFLISGYLITLLLKKEWEREGWFSLRKFYFRRVLRIFPVFYSFIIVLTLLWTAGLVTTHASTILSAALYVWNYSFIWFPHNDPHLYAQIDQGFAIFAHFWTLSCEEQFYLLWPLTLYFFGFRKGSRIAVAVVLLLPVSRIVTYVLWPAARGQMMIMLHTTADPIMAGCLMAVWQGEPWWEKIKDYLDNGRIAIAATIFVIFISPVLQLTVGGTY
ncbi:MAG: acyltransferase family protein, partial [Pyrinomonadaceae bacterium]